MPQSNKWRVVGGGTVTNYREMLQDGTGTLTDPSDEDLSAAREGRRNEGISVALALWSRNDCASMEVATGGKLCKDKPPQVRNLAEAARLRRLLTGYFDGGYLVVLAKLETW